MPVVTVVKHDLVQRIGEEFGTTEAFDDLCFRFGTEFDGEEMDEQGRATWRVEVAANRYDLLSLEGLSTALRVFTGKQETPTYRLCAPNPTAVINVHGSTKDVRPYVVGAILRNVRLDEAAYKSFIDLQDKLHHNICRRRQLVAIGTHDLDTVQMPFRYMARRPEDIRFVPLAQKEEHDGHSLMKLYGDHHQLKAYLPIIRESPVYPVILDSTDVVCSLPPIINGEHSKITLDTRNIFVECTARDLTKAEMVLNVVVSAFSEYCQDKFTIEPVQVVYETGHPLQGQTFTYPNPAPRPVRLDVNYVRRLTGMSTLTTAEACQLLSRMMLGARSEGDGIMVTVPMHRSDVLHPCDLAEDVAVAFGYNNLPKKKFFSVVEQPVMSLSQQLRRTLATCNFHETLNWGLCSHKEAFEWFQMQPSAVCGPFAEYSATGPPVVLSNPKTREFEIVRTSLLPGLLKTVASNKAAELPLKLFELGDICTIDETCETRSRNRRHVAALYAGAHTSGLEVVAGLLDHVLQYLQLVPAYAAEVQKGDRVYTLVPEDHSAFVSNRRVRIEVDSKQIGIMGVLSPDTTAHFGLQLPTTVFEFTLEPFLDWLPETDLFDQ
ncbi:MAG: uncharacterized protein KVP18_000729 [Porospora cf. gigantea A]|uniref:uncharacterized protein n=1 Tax=Porospora cf. gigantea A TaxID=2853593 RepID=UPI003559EB3D|nr:MAG: hypothetical protein KVP18_000729 [Porospora cf. gigantea A]